jgi:aspartyl-tRNA(Asn)/glutamyl-tRNA(Gln) amidotransferase subunit A
MRALPDLSLVEARDAIADGRVSPVEYVEALLSRIERLNSRLHAFIEVDAEGARAAAARCEKERGERPLPPLFGIPFAVKDIIDVAGSVTTCQSRAGFRRPAAKTAECVVNLLQAGGIYIGKTALYEFALGGPSFDEPWSPVRNPWNLDYTPGSSSSGSGAAVAARLVPLAVGTDTGGSIRSPAMMNGVVGLKPTHGRVSTVGLFPLAPSMDTVGPLARSVADVSLAFDCMLGQSSAPLRLPGTAPRLARIDHLWRKDLKPSPDLVAVFDQAMADLDAAGARIVDRELATLKTFNAVGWITLYAEALEVHREGLKAHPDRFGVPVRDMLLTGAFVTAADYLRAQNLRRHLTQGLEQCLSEVDAVVTAISALPACRLEDGSAMAELAAASTRVICNVTGHPALALPIGFSAEGLPIGIQVIGRVNGERDLLEVGAWIERHVSAWLPTHCPSVVASQGAELPS